MQTQQIVQLSEDLIDNAHFNSSSLESLACCFDVVGSLMMLYVPSDVCDSCSYSYEVPYASTFIRIIAFWVSCILVDLL